MTMLEITAQRNIGQVRSGENVALNLNLVCFSFTVSHIKLFFNRNNFMYETAKGNLVI